METDWDLHWKKGDGKFLWGGWNWIIARAYKNMIKNLPIDNFSLLELGAGSGKNSYTIYKSLNLKDITLLDFNKKALKICEKTFAGADIPIDYVHGDVFKFNPHKKFDVVHSEGLIEHFYGEDRAKMFQRHADLCKPNGYVIIFVPYHSFQYTCFELFCKTCGTWRWDEKIFTHKEIHSLCECANLEIIKEVTSPLIHEIGILAQKRET